MNEISGSDITRGLDTNVSVDSLLVKDLDKFGQFVVSGAVIAMFLTFYCFQMHSVLNSVQITYIMVCFVAVHSTKYTSKG